jgi:hypothetical protein
MPNDRTGGTAIDPVAVAPAAFADLAAKINELVAAMNASQLSAGVGLKITTGTYGMLITLDPDQTNDPTNPNSAAGGVGGGGSSSSTYTFTACVNGTPKSFDIPIAAGPY